VSCGWPIRRRMSTRLSALIICHHSFCNFSPARSKKFHCDVKLSRHFSLGHIHWPIISPQRDATNFFPFLSCRLASRLAFLSLQLNMFLIGFRVVGPVHTILPVTHFWKLARREVVCVFSLVLHVFDVFHRCISLSSEHAALCS
jgi:hypothetical protein